MNILVLNGSPKGNYSITLQTINYLLKLHPEHDFSVLNVGQRIKSIEKNFLDAAKLVNNADLLIFCYPVYTFIAPYQMHRFIELLKDSGVSLKGKIATQITTSKHFYDVTAHNYINENCFDMGMKIVGGLSQDMDDLLKKEGQEQARSFFDHLIFCVENHLFEERVSVVSESFDVSCTVPAKSSDRSEKQVVVVTNCKKDDKALALMIDRFCALSSEKTKVVNISEYSFSGGCLGCFNCATRGKCIYKDGFDTFLREEIQKNDAIVYAFTIKDHSMGASFKLFDDRQFCNGHRTVTMGRPVGYIVNGKLSCETNLKTIIEARAQVGGNFLAGIATNEKDPNEAIDKLSKSLTYALENNYAQPSNFYGVGGMKIFRDLIWLMQGMMKADHKFYKKHRQYDFPQKKCGTMVKMYLVGALISSPKVKAKMGNKMNEGMLAPYKKVIDALGNKKNKK